MASTSTSGRGDHVSDPFLVLEPPNITMKSSLSVKHYDVFINHRGPDVKTTLALQLYNSLHNAGISAYLDCEETELGDSISSTIKNAIFSARVHIAIFSPRYAESAWCLAELALMFQTRARIIPLFYNVEPSDFRHIKGGVADAFRKHEEKDRYPNHEIQRWKDCLQNVSGIMGYRINGQNDDLSKLCCDVVSAVVKEKRKRKIPLEVAKYPVGLDELVTDFRSHCQSNGEMKDKIIGIFGMGGSGKTTLAKYLFNCKHSEFSGSTILFDVRENDVKGTLTSLQCKLLSDLFPDLKEMFSTSIEDGIIIQDNDQKTRKVKKFASIEDGVSVIKDTLQKSRESRFLIVIDDADHQKQFEALVPMDALNPNSLVIVTTRDERLLIQAGVRFRYKMKEMNPQHSKELFCWHAFHRQSCKSGFENLVDSFVKACGGLPLALRVLGGHVFGSDKSYWKLQLDAVKARPDKDIKQKLKISYDALEEDHKHIFMDIACFFIGKDVSEVISIWKASKWRVEHSLQTLKDKCLVELQLCVDTRADVEKRYVLRMHDHLRDLGRDMADNEMSNPCRLWRPTDFTEMQSIITAAEGKNFRYYSDYSRQMTYLLEISKTSTDFQWLKLYYKDIPDWIPLQNLQSLRLEGVSNARLWQRNDQVPLNLKELYWNFRARMFGVALNEVVSSIGMLKHLEVLNLVLCYSSAFLEWNHGFTVLEWNCFLKSLRKLTNLKTLVLEWRFIFIMRGEATDDESTDSEVEKEFTLSNRGETTDEDQFPMKSLEAITLSAFEKIRRVSISGQLCPALKSLKLCSMLELIEVDLTGVTTLECLVLVRCEKLRRVLCNDLVQLEMLRIKWCHTMSELPNFGRLSCVKRIYINGCGELQNISAIERLKGLKRIWIANCRELKNIKAVEQLKGLKRIWIEGCDQLEGVVCFKELKWLKRMFIGNCPRLQNIQGIESLIRLESIIIAGCWELQNIRGIEELKGLKEMIISDAPSIICDEKLQRLPWELTILVSIPAMSDLIVNEDDEYSSPMPFLNADKIGNILFMADSFCETEHGSRSIKEVEEMIHSFHIKTQKSLSTFIFCAFLGDLVFMKRDICNGTKIVFDGDCYLKEIQLCNGGGDRIYMCVVNEERLSKYDSWMPSAGSVHKAFVMGVKKGEERKALHILQSLFTQLCLSEVLSDARDNAEVQVCLSNAEVLSDAHDNAEVLSDAHDIDIDYLHEYDDEDSGVIDIDDLHEYDDEDDEYDSGDDDHYDDVS